MIDRVRRTLRDRRLLEPGQRVICACSGGPDSVAMTHLLGRLARELGVTLLVASVDHGLRAASHREVQAVGALARSLELPFQPLAVRVEGGPATSMQAAARAARYGALRELAAQVGATRIAVGHTQDDQAETVLDRILRGAGVRGLGGIAPRRRDGVVRPLIDCRREEVHRYVAREGLPTASDPSNVDRRFQRVRIRLDLLPALGAEDPALVPHLARLADDARDAARLIAAEGRRLLARAGWPDRDPRAPVLAAGPAAARRAALRRWAVAHTGAPPRRSHLEALEHLLEGGGEVLLGGGWGARLWEGRLVAARRGGRRTRSTRECD